MDQREIDPEDFRVFSSGTNERGTARNSAFAPPPPEPVRHARRTAFDAGGDDAEATIDDLFGMPPGDDDSECADIDGAGDDDDLPSELLERFVNGSTGGGDQDNLGEEFADDDHSDLEEPDDEMDEDSETAGSDGAPAGGAAGKAGQQNADAVVVSRANQILNAIGFKGADFPRYKFASGEGIERDDEEVQRLREMAKQFREKKGRTGAGDDAVAEVFVEKKYENKSVRKIKCTICRFSGGEGSNAYNVMKRYDIKHIGEKLDPLLFQDLANVFNAEQRRNTPRGEELVLITVQQVMQHFKYHDLNNPLRGLAANVRLTREMLDGMRKHIRGRASDGSRMWLESKTRALLSVLREHEHATMLYTLKRAEILHSLDQTSARHGPVKSRGAGRTGKFAHAYNK